MELDKNLAQITPSTIEDLLRPQGISARYVFVLESEGRAGDPTIKQVPRFTVGGKRANKNPNLVKLDELYEITLRDYSATNIPSGWSRIHEYVYVLGDDRDRHGWEYRSNWTDGNEVGPDDEQWRGESKDAAVRRRIWMTSVVKTEFLQRAKQAISEAFQSYARGNKNKLMMGPLYVQERGMGGIRKTWEERECVLKPDCIEVYLPRETNKIIGGTETRKCLLKIDLVGVSVACCSVNELQLSGQHNTFSIRERDTGKILGLFDANEVADRKRWLHAINYQIALGSDMMNFPPLDMSPPADRECPDSTLVFGFLDKKGHFRPTWKHRFFQLTPYELQYYDGVIIKGKVPLKGSRLVDEKGVSRKFSICTSEGYVLYMEADTLEHKKMWLAILDKQLDWIVGLDKRILARQTEGKKAVKNEKSKEQVPAQSESVKEAEEHGDREAYFSIDGDLSQVSASFSAPMSETHTESTEDIAKDIDKGKDEGTEENIVTGIEGGKEQESKDPMFRPSEYINEMVFTETDTLQHAEKEFGEEHGSDRQIMKLDTEAEALQSLEEVTRLSFAFEIMGTKIEEGIDKMVSTALDATIESVDIGDSDDDDHDEDGIGISLPGPPPRNVSQRSESSSVDAGFLYNKEKKGLKAVERDTRDQEERASISDFPELPTHIIQKHGNRRSSRVVQGIARYESEKKGGDNSNKEK